MLIRGLLYQLEWCSGVLQNQRLRGQWAEQVFSISCLLYVKEDWHAS